ncbi:FUSC family protein [Sphingobacterium sp. Mn56C]|uniref:FUSC family protein n=1 Tax=Sphingobacterium sp. Mn56C TaxID=3395261 RepID=UPI003BDC21A2
MVHKIIKFFISSPLLIYAIRCLIGFFIGYGLFMKYPEYELFWTLLSIILVISPEERDSRRLSIERFKSNFIGSIVALVCLVFHDSNLYLILTGMLLTIIVCRIFKVMNMARVALVALLIIMVQPHHTAMNVAPIFRCASVGLGCIIGLTIVVLTSMALRPLKRRYEVPY